MREAQVGAGPSKSESLVRIVTAVLVGQVALAASLVGVAYLVLSVPAHMLLVPFLLIASCGLVFAPQLYWARLARARPKAYVIRLGLALFVYVELLTLAGVASEIWLGIESEQEALTSDVPFLMSCVTVVSIVVYIQLRSMFAGTDSGRAGQSESPK